MFYKSPEECRQFVDSTGHAVDGINVIPPGEHRFDSVSVSFEKLVTKRVLAEMVTKHLGGFASCLFCVVEYGIWPSSEDLNLYYRLRSTYRDYRELWAAPGHLFLSHERADLITFLSLALQFGWGGYVVTAVGEGHVSVSHDGWLRLSSTLNLDPLMSALASLNLQFEFEQANPDRSERPH